MPNRNQAFALLSSGLLAFAAFGQSGDIADLRQAFSHPPDDARIMMRWWWFGAAVTRPELEREMRAMKEGGIGGFEVQPVYPLALDDPERGFRNLPYLSQGFLDALRFTAQTARALGLRMDITLASGWPYGGPHIPITEASARLRCDHVAVPAGANSLPLPDMENGERLLAVFLAPGDRSNFSAQGVEQLHDIERGRLQLPSHINGSHVVLFFIASRTGQMVKRAAVGADGFVLNHYSLVAIANHLKTVGERLMEACGPNPPYAVFSDSLEVYGADWTDDFLQHFHQRRGYDLTHYLPALIGDIGEKTDAVRHDWGQTLTELAGERYLTPIREWASRHGTRFRSQTYGTPPVSLSSNALVDLPEGEGWQWRAFSATRWASSASHLYGRPVTSSETWTWLHSPAFRATPLDMKAEADLHFLQGINQLIGHGWPYSPAQASEPGWRFYAAAVFNNHNPWWLAMPEITKYLQRVSFALRQGKPVNDIAIYLPTDDAWARFTAGHVTINGMMQSLLGPDLIPAILDAGYDFDFIDDPAMGHAGIPYRVLILPGVERMPLATYQRIEAYLHKGGIVLATRRTPSLAPGLLDGSQTAQIQEFSRRLLKAPGRIVADEKSELAERLHALLQPDVSSSPNAPEIGFLHRKLESADIYFLANTSNRPRKIQARFRVTGLAPEWWNPFTGGVSSAVVIARAKASVTVTVDLPPYGSNVLVFSAHPASPQTPEAPASRDVPAPLDLNSGWRVSFPSLGRTAYMQQLHSWTDEEPTRYFSGQAVYEKTVAVPPGFVRSDVRVWLNFGKGTPLPPTASRGPGMRAWLESPVREAAMVEVNGRPAGAVWHPPYEVAVTGLIHAGENRIRVRIGNLGINALAGQSLPKYRLLDSRYGERFQPQDMENLQPLAAGLLGPVSLIPR